MGVCRMRGGSISTHGGVTHSRHFSLQARIHVPRFGMPVEAFITCSSGVGEAERAAA